MRLFSIAIVALFAAGCTGGSSMGASSGKRPIAYRAHASQAVLPFTNGFAAGAYETGAAARRLTMFRDHIYARKSATEVSKDFANEVYFGYRRAGVSQWLPALPEQELGYVPGTGIVRALQRAGGIAFETFFFAPMTGGAERAVVCLVHATNESGAAIPDCGLFCLLDLHLGGEGDAAREWVWKYEPGALMEGKEGSSNRAVYKAIGPLSHWCAGLAGGPNDPAALVNAGRHLTDGNDAQTPADDARLGLEAAIGGGGDFAAGADAWFGVAILLSDDGDETAIRAAASRYVGNETAAGLLAREIAFWDAFHRAERFPASATPGEIALARQSAAVLKMAQCREAGAGAGQIVASLPPGAWNIAWVRDGCYAIEALVSSGHLEEAKAGLAFFLNATAGGYRAEVGGPYRISVCRYTGDGTEESDDNGQGPNIELDGFGLFLRALARYMEASGDAAFLAAAWPEVRGGVADVLVSLIDRNDLIRADSSIWERHLFPKAGTPDGAKQFAYTSIQAAAGLRAAAYLAGLVGDSAKQAAYGQAADRIAAAIERELALGDVLCSSVEEKALGIDFALDASVADAIVTGVLAARGPLAAGTIATLDRLRVFGLGSPGYLRNDDAKSYGPDNWYDRQEWVFCDLRVASALARMGRKEEARLLSDWVTAQSRANFDLVAELYDEASADYRGAVPMAGFGAGAYILALFDRYGP
jgi:GH15 family glucan-1,4-alpha-glucosidase